ncbi:MAG: XRE family transcriptional regulator [Ruminococcaceae bacterium]|nr:XRE family transcriptional regulator [Oscillospiraceae bacterium]
MVIDEQIKMLCVKSNISVSEIGRRLNKTPQAFSQKIKRGNFTVDELSEIALVSGCQLKCEFVFPDGYRVVIE